MIECETHGCPLGGFRHYHHRLAIRDMDGSVFMIKIHPGRGLPYKFYQVVEGWWELSEEDFVKEGWKLTILSPDYRVLSMSVTADSMYDVVLDMPPELVSA